MQSVGLNSYRVHLFDTYTAVTVSLLGVLVSVVCQLIELPYGGKCEVLTELHRELLRIYLLLAQCVCTLF